MSRRSALSVFNLSLLCALSLPLLTVKAETLEQSVPASILSLKDSLVSAEISANISQIKVDVGDTVKKGDELAHLDCREYDARFEQSQANIETVNAQVLTAESIIKTRASEIAGSKANEDLVQAQVNAENSRISLANAKYDSAKSRVRADLAKCKLANLELQRSRTLRKQRFISQQELDKAEMEYEAAQAECSAVQSALVGVKFDIATARANARAAQAKVKAQQSKTSAAKSNFAAAKADITAVKSKLSAAKASLKTEELMVSRCIIAAPFNGQIVKRMVQLGQRIAQGEKAFQLISINDAEVTATLSSLELESIKQAKTIYFATTDSKIPVTLRSVVAIVTGQARTQEARFEFKQENTFPIGLNGRVIW